MNKANIEIPYGLKKILIQSKKNVFSALAGRNISKFKGSGLDFADLKEYSYGDDIKFIDWIISAKNNTLIIKEFYEEKELDIKIFAMYGASMYFGSCELKSNILLKVVSFLGFLSVKNTDLLSIYNASNECELLTKPTKNAHIVEECLRKIYAFKPLGKKVNFDDMVYQIRKTIKRKSMIFFVGDFIGDYDFSKISNKHEIICIIIRDRLEEDIFTANNIDYLNPQTLNNNKISINRLTKSRYSQKIKDNDDNMRKNMHKNKITYLKIYTDEDPYVKLIKFLR
jgi:uncharacterized protein (DUF58 family)